MNVLIIGGAGYIGSHTCLELLCSGFDISVIDNFSNSSIESIRRVEKIAKKKVSLYEGDIRDSCFLENVFSKNKIDAVVHFAGLKSVGDSVSKPIDYYDNNVTGTIDLLKTMNRYNVKNFVFSSSATVYGQPDVLPLKEDSSRSATNPYGQSKLMVEYILEDIAASDLQWKIVCLRYFNPVGAHSSGLIGEDPRDTPNNLMPYISQVASGKRVKVNVFGNDYPTADGTGVRDYIHVVDLAKGHLAALKYISSNNNIGFSPFNLGRGKGISVLQLIEAFRQASGCDIPFEFVERRPGDVAECYAAPDHANQKLNWKAELSLTRMCEDAWRWQKNNPNGYGK